MTILSGTLLTFSKVTLPCFSLRMAPLCRNLITPDETQNLILILFVVFFDRFVTRIFAAYQCPFI